MLAYVFLYILYKRLWMFVVVGEVAGRAGAGLAREASTCRGFPMYLLREKLNHTHICIIYINYIMILLYRVTI